ncbi:MAG: 23S rRNA (adenine(2503)-C(2))-methyltransferase RlmN [Schwartzia sp. (in: firmicutes)]
MENLFGQTVTEIAERIVPLGLPSYRARQIAAWMYQKGSDTFSAMTDLPQRFRGVLTETFAIERGRVIAQWDSSDGVTTKFLLGFPDGIAVEAVLMRQTYGNSICISTQAGCAMGCTFCASTLHGIERNLTCGEMLAEVLFIEEKLRAEGAKVDTIVLMGTGEPLMNYDSVLSFLRLLHEPYCLGLGYRHITLSTSGIVPGIVRLREEGLPITLSISLHAANDEIRTQLMPINRRYPIRELIAAGRAYGAWTKRRVTYEYILIAGVNDGEEEARELSRLLRGQLAGVNLIPFNPVRESTWQRPSEGRIRRFVHILTERHLAVTVRKEMGADIQAACGQLRNQYLEKRADDL